MSVCWCVFGSGDAHRSGDFCWLLWILPVEKEIFIQKAGRENLKNLRLMMLSKLFNMGFVAR